MEIKTFLTGYLTAKVLKPVIVIIILFLLVHQCNRGCGRDQVGDTGLFDYTAIATSLPMKDTIPVDTLIAAEDLKEIIPSEMIEFAKDHSSLFAKYLSMKYMVSNGYVEKIERSNLDSRISNSD